MKIKLTIIATLTGIVLNAQEPQIIGGYLLDGKDSFEELEKKADMRMYARKMMGADE